MIYLDNAATTGKKPLSVINATVNALKHYSSNPGRSGHLLSQKVAEEIYSCRSLVKEFTGAKSESNVCFTLNCTQAVNMVLNGVLENGDHLIISSLEHNAVYRPSEYLKLKGVEVDITEVSLYDNKVTLNNIKKLIKNNTKMIFITSGSNVMGRVLPIKEIGELCYENEILFGLDAAQGIGILDINMKKMHIDYLCIASHKGLYAPMGTGILIADREIKNILISGGTGVNSIEPYQPEDLPERLESGTLNVSGIMGIKSGLEFVKNKGIRKIYTHEMKLCQYLYKKLENMNAELYTPYPEIGEYLPVISFNKKGESSELIGNILNKNSIAVRTGLHCAPLAHRQLGTIDTGTVRVSPSYFNNFDEIERLIFVLKRVI